MAAPVFSFAGNNVYNITENLLVTGDPTLHQEVAPRSFALSDDNNALPAKAFTYFPDPPVLPGIVDVHLSGAIFPSSITGTITFDYYYADEDIDFLKSG